MAKTATKTLTKTASKAAPTNIYNKVAFAGRLGCDPEMNYTPSGKEDDF